MQQQEGFKRFLPHIWVIAIFIAMSCAFCYPSFQGKILDQHDTKSWLWSSKETRDYLEHTGEEPLWSNSAFSGMPQPTSAHENWYGQFGQALYGGLSNPALYFFLAMIGFYILMCTLRINKWLGALGALAFAFSSYNPIIVTAGHITKMLDISFIPAILAGIILAYRGRYFAGAAIAGIFLTFFFNCNHLQIIYYTIFLVIAMVVAALIGAIRKKELRTWVLGSVALAVAAIAAALANASALLQTEEYSAYSIRGGKKELVTGQKEQTTGLDKDYAFSWSNGATEVFSILVPNLFGGSIAENIGEDSHYGKKLSELGVPPDGVDQMTRRAPLYWGPQPLLSGSVYFGAVICLLFVLSLFIIKSKYKWWLAGTALFFIFVSMGKNFSTLNYFMFDHFPLFNKFRSPNMALSISSVIFPMLAIWALKDIMEEKISKEELWKKAKYSLIITAGLSALLLVSTQTMLDYKGQRDDQMAKQYGEAGPQIIKALREDRSSAATGDALRSLVFVLLAGGTIWAYSKNKIKKIPMLAGLGVLILVDLLPVAHRYLNEDHYLDAEEYQAENFQPSPADATILQDKDPYYRVFDLTSGDPFGEAKPSYFHKSVGGYSAIKMQIYQDLIERQIGRLNGAVLNMLNTKYFIVPGPNNKPMPQQNPGALGNAWFVSDIQWVKTAEEEMNALNAAAINNPMDSTAGHFNPAQTAVVRETYKSQLGNDPIGKDAAAYVKLVPGGYNLRRMKFESSNTQNGLAVFSDIYYPLGWKATVDGKEVPIIRTDYVLRAIKVPAGKHTIEFVISETPAQLKGGKLALVGSVLLTLLLLSGVYFTFFKKGGIQPTSATDTEIQKSSGGKK